MVATWPMPSCFSASLFMFLFSFFACLRIEEHDAVFRADIGQAIRSARLSVQDQTGGQAVLHLAPLKRAIADLAEFVDRWERDWATANVGLKTFERYRQLLRLYVKPHIG